MGGINRYAQVAKHCLLVLWGVFFLSVFTLVVCDNLGYTGTLKSAAGVISLALGIPLLGTIQYFVDAVEKVSGRYGVTVSDDVRQRIAPVLKYLNADVQIGSYSSDEANAFAISSVFGTKSLIAFSSSLLSAADDSRLMAIAAHEIAHLKNGDSRNKTFILAFSQAVQTYPYLLSEISKELLKKTAIMLAIFFGIFLLIAFLGPGNAFKGLRPADGRVLLVFIWPVGVIAGYFVLNHLLNRAFYAYSREREFAADADGAMMTSHQDMISAISLLAENDEGVISVFDTHPSFAERRKRLNDAQANYV